MALELLPSNTIKLNYDFLGDTQSNSPRGQKRKYEEFIEDSESVERLAKKAKTQGVQPEDMVNVKINRVDEFPNHQLLTENIADGERYSSCDSDSESNTIKDRFPGFAFCPLSLQLNYISDALLLNFPHKRTTELIALFNDENISLVDALSNSIDCCDNILVSRLVHRLRQVQRIPDRLNENDRSCVVQFKCSAYRMLGILSRSELARHLIHSENGLEMLIYELSHPTDVCVYEECCFAFGNLSHTITDNELFSKRIRDEKVIETMFKIYQANSQSWKLCRQICFALVFVYSLAIVYI
eukprot:TRINITY_DN996_c0_g1_i2.p1 TRINITY_DN996_c0_g1~~TRINITY_DN996_c0_g1_i2.p1  ORF type:complete len:298 (-),score=5.29 TRINITY_DN996_c0_g1_i2:748-1641(-)